MTFALDPRLAPALLADAFAKEGRLQIVDFLSRESAAALFSALSGSNAWRLALNRGHDVVSLGLDEMATWSAEKRKQLDLAVIEGGQTRFQFRYETIRPGKAPPRAAPPLLDAFIEFLSSSEIVGFMRALTGAGDISFADGHATRYQPGDFLTLHDDRNPGMGRRAAYVLNLTPEWRPDWGGVLQFYDERSNVVRGFTPAFNVLNIFRVPQPHSVSMVTPLARRPRLAVTGWLRADTGRGVLEPNDLDCPEG